MEGGCMPEVDDAAGCDGTARGGVGAGGAPLNGDGAANDFRPVGLANDTLSAPCPRDGDRSASAEECSTSILLRPCAPASSSSRFGSIPSTNPCSLVRVKDTSVACSSLFCLLRLAICSRCVARVCVRF